MAVSLAKVNAYSIIRYRPDRPAVAVLAFPDYLTANDAMIALEMIAPAGYTYAIRRESDHAVESWRNI